LAFEVVTSIYYLLLSLALATVGPYLLLSKKARSGIFQKLGFIPKALSDSVARLPATCPRVWFHAVSVGEFNALFPLVEKFHKEHPEYQIFISTTTGTGQELARSRASSFAQVFYFPIDLPWMISSWLDLLRPSLVGIVETEIWPGFMSECHRRGIKVVLVNGRLSPRGFKGYMRWQWFFAPVISKFNALAVQSEAEKDRFVALAGSDLPVSVCGNIKLDGLEPGNAEETAKLRTELNLNAAELVVVAGSTHEGEESALLAALKSLKGGFRLILAPRHPERFDRALQLIESNGFRARRFSRQEGFAYDHDVYLLDTIGQLNKFYSLADIAFVGGTLANVGGHNLAEPCAYKAPVLCGPHVYKTKDLFQRLREREALLMVHDEKELISTIQMLLDSPGVRKELGENGYRFLAESQGALGRTLAVLEKYLDGSIANPQMKVQPPEGVRR
jgi:3-deoxy-D-manno-octulosonic-acid transferase